MGVGTSVDSGIGMGVGADVAAEDEVDVDAMRGLIRYLRPKEIPTSKSIPHTIAAVIPINTFVHFSWLLGRGRTDSAVFPWMGTACITGEALAGWGMEMGLAWLMDGCG